jgi:membrane-associated phospholipid phosphatase
VPSLLDALARFDREALEATQELRWEPLTALFLLATAWWVKGCVFASVGAVMDARARRWFPATALVAVVVGVLAELLAVGLKETFDRARPPEDEALSSLPGSPSFPSGHAMTAFAVASAFAVLAPRARWPVLALAATIAFSRVYLGVHFWVDVLVGAALGAAVGMLVARAVRRAAARQARAGAGEATPALG